MRILLYFILKKKIQYLQKDFLFEHSLLNKKQFRKTDIQMMIDTITNFNSYKNNFAAYDIFLNTRYVFVTNVYISHNFQNCDIYFQLCICTKTILLHLIISNENIFYSKLNISTLKCKTKSYHNIMKHSRYDECN